MPDYPILANAPITEALLDIKVTLPKDTDLDRLASIHDRVHERYPNRQPRENWHIEAFAAPGTEPSLSRSGGQIGFLFSSPALGAADVFQARLDGFTYSRLKPYQTWAAFKTECKDLWEKYVEVAKPIEVKRVGLRTINRLPIPLPLSDFREYILTGPQIAPGLPHGLSQFFMQAVIPQPETTITAIITTAMDSLQPDATVVNVLFDTDVYVQQEVSPRSSALWDISEKLRATRNTIFFQSLTEKAKELFQ